MYHLFEGAFAVSFTEGQISRMLIFLDDCIIVWNCGDGCFFDYCLWLVFEDV